MNLSSESTPQGYALADLDQIAPVPCPCGFSRRAFADPQMSPASLHRVDISVDSQTHYHKQLTEIYYVLEGEGRIELDGESFPLRPGSSVLIKPGTRHRAVGRLQVIVVSMPPFDPSDEFVVEDSAPAS